jgi:ankyrin repeat protein
MNIELANYLVQTYKITKLETLDSIGFSYLHHCVFLGEYKVAKLLLCSGFNPNILSSYGTTPLEVAIRLGKGRFICLLKHFCAHQ